MFKTFRTVQDEHYRSMKRLLTALHRSGDEIVRSAILDEAKRRMIAHNRYLLKFNKIKI